MRQAGPRFTIRSLMIAIAVVAGLLAHALTERRINSPSACLYSLSL